MDDISPNQGQNGMHYTDKDNNDVTPLSMKEKLTTTSEITQKQTKII